jgi:hypothetical protein
MYSSEQHVWVFNGGGQFPGGVFTTIDRAEAWISRHWLTGVLTAYPLDEGCFDWAVCRGITNLKAETLATKSHDPGFIGAFSTASQEHYHYENGKRRA